jgi:hypothetical protein
MNGIVGSILVILGVLCLAGSAIVVAGVCAKTMAAAALLHVATCDQTTATFFVLLLVGIGFLIAGAIVLFKGRQKQTRTSEALVPEAEPPRTQPTTSVTRSAAPVVYCRQCGRQAAAGTVYCDQCGARL